MSALIMDPVFLPVGTWENLSETFKSEEKLFSWFAQQKANAAETLLANPGCWLIIGWQWNTPLWWCEWRMASIHIQAWICFTKDERSRDERRIRLKKTARDMDLSGIWSHSSCVVLFLSGFLLYKPDVLMRFVLTTVKVCWDIIKPETGQTTFVNNVAVKESKMCPIISRSQIDMYP